VRRVLKWLDGAGATSGVSLAFVGLTAAATCSASRVS